VAERHGEYGRIVSDELRKAGVRVEIDDRDEKMGYKIREAQMQKVPYMLVVGDKEIEAGTVAVRHRQAGDLGASSVSALASKIASLAAQRATHEEAVPPGATGGVS
jgi:threonyl-tRNA synthetase